MKKIYTLGVLLVFMMILGACQKEDEEIMDVYVETTEELSYEEILEKAKGTTVSFYGWGGDENINTWLDQKVAIELKELYNITLERVPMVPPEYLPKLLNEKQAESEGTIDIVWINGENFYTAKSQDLLFGPFVDKLPNYNNYVDTNSDDNLFDFGHEIEGFEAPYGKAQMVYIVNTEHSNIIPTSHELLLEYVKANPKKVTYPDLVDFTGSAFVRNIIYDIVGHEPFLSIEADKEVVREAIMPAMDYLNSLKPYLWREGKTYPATVAQLDNMYSDGEVYITMNYTPFHIATKIAEGAFETTSKSFVFDKGSIGNTHFMAIPFNAQNSPGAMVVINHIMSPSIQASKFDPDVWGDLPVLDTTKLSKEEKILFDAIELGEGVLSPSELLSKRLPEMRAELVPIIEEIWREEVLNEK